MSNNLLSAKFDRHRGPVTGVVESFSTGVIVTSAYDGAVGIIEKDKFSVLGYHDHLVNKISASNHNLIATCSSDYTIKIWNLKSRALIQTLRGHSDDVEDFVFINQETGVSAGRDTQLIVWDLQTGAIKKIVQGHKKDVLSLAADDEYLYSCGDDKTLRVWNLNSFKQVQIIGPFHYETDTCAIDMINKRIIIGCDDGYIRVYRITDGLLIKEIKAHRSGIKKVSVSPKNGDILSAGYDQQILVWSYLDYALVKSLENHTSKWERSLTWSSNGLNILGGTFDGTVVIWNALEGNIEKEIGKSETDLGNPCINEVEVLNDKVVSVSDDGIIRISSLKDNWEQYYDYVSLQNKVLMNAVTIDSVTKVIICGTHDQKVMILEETATKHFEEKIIPINSGPINTIKTSSNFDGRPLSFVGSYNGYITVIDNVMSTVEKHWGIHEGAVKAIAIHPTKPIGISCSAASELFVWNEGGEIVQKLYGHTEIINDISISPSGNLLATASRDFCINIYDLNSYQLVGTYKLGNKSLKSICFINEFNIIVGDYWGNIIKVEVETGYSTKKRISSNGISSLARKNDTQFIASSYSGSLYHMTCSEDGFSLINQLKFMEQRVDSPHRFLVPS